MRIAKICKSPSKTIHYLLSEPSSSTLAFIVSIVLTSFIIGSCLAFILETLPQYKYPQYGKNPGDKWIVFETFECITVYVFIIEYLLRLITVPSVDYPAITRNPKAIDRATEDIDAYIKQLRCQCCFRFCPIYIHKMAIFFIQPFNLIDFISLIPGFISLTPETHIAYIDEIHGMHSIRILRLFRVFRLLKSGKLLFISTLFVRTLKRSQSAILMLAFVSCVISTIFGSLMFFMESGEWVEDGCDDNLRGCYMRPTYFGQGLEESPFFSIPQSIWWTFVSISTVGYGDLYPTTNYGKMLAIIVLHVGILVIAMPITIIHTNFSTVWKHHQRKKEKKVKDEAVRLKALEEETEQSTNELLNEKLDEINEKLEFLMKCEHIQQRNELQQQSKNGKLMIENGNNLSLLQKLEQLVHSELSMKEDENPSTIDLILQDKVFDLPDKKTSAQECLKTSISDQSSSNMTSIDLSSILNEVASDV